VDGGDAVKRLQAVGVRKFVPGQDALDKAYRRAHRTKFINKELLKVMDNYNPGPVEIPEDLESKIRGSIEGSSQAWDNVIADFL